MNLQEQLSQCLNSYATDGLYTIGGIPAEKLTNAIQNFPIDARDTVLALIDATVMGSCKKGIAFGLRGAYWKNDWTTKTQRNFMTWDELSSIDHMISTNTFDLILGPGNACNLSGANVKPAQAANLLLQLIAVYDDFKQAENTQQPHAPVLAPTQPSPVATPAIAAPTTAPSQDLYQAGLIKAFAAMICADGVLDDAEIELAVQFLEADDAIQSKSAAMEDLTSLIESLHGEFEKSKPLFKLKCSKLVAQIREEITGPSREHAKVMISELFDQVRQSDTPDNKEMHDKLIAALSA